MGFEEMRELTCPYCKHKQNDLNVEKRLYTSTNWRGFKCEKCKRLFAYMQIVQRAYIAVEVDENG